MPTVRSSHVEVYVFRRRGRRVEFLALHRAPHRKVLPGVWQPITGGREPRERAVDAARRELMEEIGLSPLRMWRLETVTTYWNAEKDALVVLPLFAAEIDARATVRLSDEHDDHAFLSAAAAGRRFLWDTQRRGLEAVVRQIIGSAERARALEIAAPNARTTRRPRRATKRGG